MFGYNTKCIIQNFDWQSMLILNISLMNAGMNNLIRVLFFLVENEIRLSVSSITQPFKISDYLNFDLFYLYKTIQYCTESVTVTYIFILCMVKYEMLGLFCYTALEISV